MAEYIAEERIESFIAVEMNQKCEKTDPTNEQEDQKLFLPIRAQV